MTRCHGFVLMSVIKKRKEKMKHVGKHVDNVLFVRCVYAHLTFFSSVFFFFFKFSL